VRLPAIPLAWLQLKREPIRFAVGLAGVTFAVTMVFMQFGFQDALFASAVRMHQHLHADLVLINPQSSFLVRMEQFARSRLYQVRAFPGVEAVTPLYLGDTIWENPYERGSRNIFVIGFDPAEPVLEMPEVEARRALLQMPDTFLFDRAARPEYGPVAAQLEHGRPLKVEVGNRQITVAGLFTLGTSFGVDGTLITSDLNFLRLMPYRKPGIISMGLVRLQPGVDARAMRDALAAALPGDVEVLTKRDLMDREVGYWARSTPIGYVFSFGTIMGLFVGAVIVYQILFTDIASHLPEYATLKAMGYTNRWLSGVVLQEALILAVVGFVPGFLLCTQLYRVTERATQLPMQMRPSSTLMVLGLTVAMCAVSATLALRKVRAADPAEIF
jgi:putative ABC transport system permease protein